MIPIIEAGQAPYGLFQSLTKYPWVGAVQTYTEATEAAATAVEAIRSDRENR